MGRSPCCAKEGLNRGAWSAREDRILTNYIKAHGEGKWRDLPQRAGLKRCGKSCRLRWLNYLRPDIKRGNISMEEEELIIKLHKLLGNRWSLIAGRLPGRTDNEIKNYWNTNLSKRVQDQKTQVSSRQLDKMKEKGSMKNSPAGTTVETHRVIRTKAVRCTRVIIPQLLDNRMGRENSAIWDQDSPHSSAQQDDDSSRFLMDFDISDLLISDMLNSDFHQAKEGNYLNDNLVDGEYNSKNLCSVSDVPISAHDATFDESTDETMLENWRPSESLQQNEALELKTLASFFNSDDEKSLFVVP